MCRFAFALLTIGLAACGDSDGDMGAAGGIAPPGASCAERYAPTRICGEDGSSCTFYTELGGVSCSDYCAARGGMCFSADANQDGETCMPAGPSSCSLPTDNQICSCNL